MRNLKAIYRLLYRTGLQLEDALRQIAQQRPGPIAEHVVRFVRSSKRGIARERRGTLS
jgi:UDP-N-acetylglucosamine acyltransferase